MGEGRVPQQQALHRWAGKEGRTAARSRTDAARSSAAGWESGSHTPCGSLGPTEARDTGAESTWWVTAQGCSHPLRLQPAGASSRLPPLCNVLWGSRQQLCDRHPVLANTAAWLSRRSLLLTAVQGSLGTADPSRSNLRKELLIWGFPQDLLPPPANTQGPLRLIHGKWYILQSQRQENGTLLSNQTWFISQQVRAAEQVI